MIVWERNTTIYWVESTYFLFSLINVLERERKKRYSSYEGNTNTHLF